MKLYFITNKSVSNIQDFQKLMKELYFEKDLKRGKEKTTLKVVEEVGELAEAILLEDINKISEELIDILAWILSVANLYDIDMSQSFREKYNNKCPRCKENPCSCKSI